MNRDKLPGVDCQPPAASSLVLERITAAALIAVLMALAWMVLAAYQPEALRLGSVPVEVGLMLLLLVAALFLISLLALRHAR